MRNALVGKLLLKEKTLFTISKYLLLSSKLNRMEGKIIRKFVLAILIFGLLFSGFNFAFAENSPQDSHICSVYFTYIGCSNCAITDPIVLTEWTENYNNFVVIEYMWYGGDWDSPNSKFFGNYAQKYQTQAAVPQIVFTNNNIKSGRIDVPEAEKDIKILKSNPCPLMDKSVSWQDLVLNDLEAEPKIWANGRVLIKEENGWLFQWDGEDLNEEIIGSKNIDNELAKNLLFNDNISEALNERNFEIVEPQKAEFSGSVFPPSYGFVPYVELENAIRIGISEDSAIAGPVQPEEQTEQPIAQQPLEEEITLPIIGKVKTNELSLPALTFLLGLADGFNPCAFFILTFLLAALIGLAGARKKIFLVGGIFVFFSALFYFLFMAVLLNVFQLGGKLIIFTIVAGIVAVIVGLLNIKDYFAFQKGISLTLPKNSKERFIQRVKNLSLAKNTWTLITASIIIAATVNLYELLCTFGFPLIYTRILSLRQLSSLQYYFHLLFYNLVYIIPLVVICLIFAITLGKKTFSKVWVKRLKLISGFMILFLGLVLIFEPKLLECISTAFGVLISAIIVSGIIILIKFFLTKKNSPKL